MTCIHCDTPTWGELACGKCLATAAFRSNVLGHLDEAVDELHHLRNAVERMALLVSVLRGEEPD